jgi:hypothetical protein
VEPPVQENTRSASGEASTLFPGSAVESFPESVTGSSRRGCVGRMSQVVRIHSVSDRNINRQSNTFRPNEKPVSIPNRNLVEGMKFSYPSDENCMFPETKRWN